MTANAFAELLRAYCLSVGASVTSWGRTLRRNAEVGGVPHSPHLSWVGADVVYDAPIPIEQREAFAEALGLRLIAEADHDHLQPADWRA